MSPWAGLVLSLVAVLVGAGVNVAAVANMFGKMSEAVKGLSTAVDKLTQRMDAMDHEGSESNVNAATLAVRLVQVEKNTNLMQDLRTELAATNATAQAERKGLREAVSKIELSQASSQRQLSTIVGVMQRKGLLYDDPPGS